MSLNLLSPLKKLLLLGAAFLMLLATSSQAKQPSQAEFEKHLQKLDPRISIESFQPAPLAGFYMVELNSGAFIYMHEDGEHFFAGNLMQLNDQGQLQDLTELERGKSSQRILAQQEPAELISFAAHKTQKAHIYVFTDVTCPYCSRLHEQVPELNKAGVKVSYLAFPRQGTQGKGYEQLTKVWCAQDKQAAMTAAKREEKVSSASCDNPVEKQYLLGQRLGIQGTPAIFLPDGRMIPGFVPAARLIQELGL